MFLGSTPVYEDDWNRYLWDGAVITEGINPYTYSPASLETLQSSDAELQTLKRLSEAHNNFHTRINNPHLTTIYPPVAQAVFAIAAFIKPFDLDVLRGLFLLSELLAMALIVRALAGFGQPVIWVWLYALNPIIIFTAFSGAHMDILLVPLILAALILVKERPLFAALALAGAVAVKLWPLILGPILFRQYRHQPGRFVFYGAVFGVVSLVFCAPMLVALAEDSGLGAYAGTWQRSSFLFPYIEMTADRIFNDGAFMARLFVGLTVTGIALWFGLVSKPAPRRVPFAMLAIILSLYLLSPTGFPWYVIWFACLLPFVPSYGAALLCVTVCLYYTRFLFGERGDYDIYLNILLPLQFGLPLFVLGVEAIKNYKFRGYDYDLA